MRRNYRSTPRVRLVLQQPQQLQYNTCSEARVIIDVIVLTCIWYGFEEVAIRWTKTPCLEAESNWFTLHKHFATVSPKICNHLFVNGEVLCKDAKFTELEVQHFDVAPYFVQLVSVRELRIIHQVKVLVDVMVSLSTHALVTYRDATILGISQYMSSRGSLW